MLKVGAINYINALPFFAAIREGVLSAPVEFVGGVPTELNRKLREGEIDVSLISSTEYLLNQDKYSVIPDFCIGAEQQVLSVCLYTKRPLSELDGKTLAVTPESGSSTQLLKVLCRHFWKITPKFETLSSCLDDMSQVRSHDAFLLIGDLSLRNPHFDGFQTIDLAQVWYYATGLSFTFAVMAGRKDVMDKHKDTIAKLTQTLHASLDWASLHNDKIIELAKKQCPVPEVTLRCYYEVLQYKMTDRHSKGLEKFHELSALTEATR